MVGLSLLVRDWWLRVVLLGPRALGNRSIIADPRRGEMWRVVNDVKGREWWTSSSMRTQHGTNS